MCNSVEQIFQAALTASRSLSRRSDAEISSMLLDLADTIERETPAIIEANNLDLARMDSADPRYDRLQLTPARLSDIAADMRSVAGLPSPVGKVLAEWERPNGMKLRKVTVPFGVIGVIYEARPNVTFDVMALCVKAGSACLLKGGSDALSTNECSIGIIRRVLAAHGFDENTATLLPAPHSATDAMLRAVGYVDLIIPRGSRRLIDYVRDNARVPVIETGAGVCHTYLHSSGRTDYARDMVFNAKTRRPSVCNTLDTLVVDASRLGDLGEVCAPLADKKVEIYADPRSYKALEGKYPYLFEAGPEDFGREWLALKMSVATVDGLDKAIEFINRYGSRHSEAIVAEDEAVAEVFTREIDAACVYVNVSTAFTDGGQYGFGAEIGISTQKLHARGPMALPEITTYKYIVSGDGLVR